jgi:ribosomal protein S17E
MIAFENLPDIDFVHSMIFKSLVSEILTKTFQTNLRAVVGIVATIASKKLSKAV